MGIELRICSDIHKFHAINTLMVIHLALERLFEVAPALLWEETRRDSRCRPRRRFLALAGSQHGGTPLFPGPGPDRPSSPGPGLFAFGRVGRVLRSVYDDRMKVYTRTGDDGDTSLFSGGRVGKAHPRIEAYGTIDELNSALGLLLAEPLPDEATGRIRAVQSALFSIGSSMADPEAKLNKDPSAWSAEPLESWIDEMDASLDELRAFILPGGSRGAALAHVARTVCRRAERRVLVVEGVDPGVVPYLNRLSDALFVLARFLNHRLGIDDPEWHPSEGNRR